MRIILCNKFYYRRGGDCVYMMELENILKQHGHNVAVFAMQYPQNNNSEWEHYFPSEVSFAVGKNLIKSVSRPIYSHEVKRKFTQLIDDFKPDIVHLNNIHSQLSPIIAKIAHKKNIKVVWTLHDYKLLCPRYDCLQNGHNVCEECFKDKRAVLKHSCMKNSLFASIIAYWEARKWNREKLETYTDRYICPSQFMADKMIQGGFIKRPMNVLCNFIDSNKCKKESYVKGDYYCYVGRLSHEKGIKTLIKAANELQYKLVIIGGGPLADVLKSMAKDHVEFVGFKQWYEIKELVGNAKFSVIPSEWYENNPISVIESKCLGTPVLGARIGGIPELIDEGKSGMTFASRDVDDLKSKIISMWNTTWDYEKIAFQAQEKYSAESYYQQLMNVYIR